MTEVRLFINDVEADVSPSDVSWQMKLGAATTFSFPYPNEDGLARGLFREQSTKVTIKIPGMSEPLLEGFVISVSNDPVAMIECADPYYFLSNKNIHPDELEPFVGWDVARVAADFITSLRIGLTDSISERVVGTNPHIPLPADFIDEPTSLDDLIKKIIEHVNTETLRLLPDTVVTYFVGFTGGQFRFERLVDIDIEQSHFTLERDINLFDEMPEFHDDRLVNRAVIYSGDEDGNLTKGEAFEDLHSITTVGVKEPERIITIEGANAYDLFIRARQEVLRNKDQVVTRNVEMPQVHWITPGLYNIDILSSVYGAEGKSRVIQNQGSIGSDGRVRIQLSTVPLDEGEVLRRVVLGTS